MSESRERHGLRISLKWLLLGVPFAGATLGLLGRSFYRDPNEFRLALLLATVVAPFILAIGTIIRLGWRSRRRMLIAWGGLLAITPFVGFGVRMFADHLYGAHGYGIVDNTTLIRQRLPNELTTPWVWQELERRVQAGSLPQAEVDEAIQTLTTHMKKNSPQGWNQPLHWEGNFVRLAAQNQLVSRRTLFDLCDAFYGDKPRFDNFFGGGFPGSSTIGIEYGNHWDVHSRLPIKLVWFPSKVYVDGTPVTFKTEISHGNRWRGRFDKNLANGDHEVTVEVECAYVDNSPAGIFDGGCVEQSKWPQQRLQTWTTSVTDQKQLFGRMGPTAMVRNEIVPTTRSTSDPVASKAVKVERIVIKRGHDQRLRIMVDIANGDHLRIPLSCDVTVKLGNRTIDLGYYFIAKWPGRSVGSESELETEIDEPEAEVNTAEVTLNPNPIHIRQVPGVTEIWGKPIVFPNVPVERIDLEEDKP